MWGGGKAATLPVSTSSSHVSLTRRYRQPITTHHHHRQPPGKAEFKLSYIANCHPVESYKATLNKDIHTLIVMGLLVEVNETKLKPSIIAHVAGASGQAEDEGHPDRTFRFVYGLSFVRSLQLMMCKSQAEELRLRVLKYVSAIEVRQRMMYMEKIGGAMGNEIELKTGMLKIRKVEVGHHQGSRRAMLQGAKRLLEGGDWKERWCVLRGRRLLMFKKQTEDTPTQVCGRVVVCGGVCGVADSSDVLCRPLHPSSGVP